MQEDKGEKVSFFQFMRDVVSFMTRSYDSYNVWREKTYSDPVRLKRLLRGEKILLFGGLISIGFVSARMGFKIGVIGFCVWMLALLFYRMLLTQPDIIDACKLIADMLIFRKKEKKMKKAEGVKKDGPKRTHAELLPK